MFIIKFCRWRYSNFRPLVSEATALPTEPQDDLSFIITKYHFPSFYAWHSGYLHRWYRKAKVRGFKYLLLGYKSQTKRSAVYTRDQISWLWKDKRLCVWIPAIHHNRHMYIFSCILVIKIFRKKKINKQGGNISHLYCRPHCFQKMGHPGLFFFIFVLSMQLTSWQKTNVPFKSLPMTGFELRTSGVGSDRSSNWATSTALQTPSSLLVILVQRPRTLTSANGMQISNIWSMGLSAITGSGQSQGHNFN